MAKINFANTAKLGFWDFVIDASNLHAPKLVSGDYKDLRAKIESGELIDGVIVMLLKEPTHDTVRYGRLYSWFLSESNSLGTLIVLNFQDCPGAPVLPPVVAIKENNEVITRKDMLPDEGPDNGDDGK